MKESKFVDKNKEKWQRFESMQKDLASDPEALSNLYLDITDDLGFAQTYYKRRTIRVYLNQLAQRIFIGVNKYQRSSFRKILDFWLVELPLEIYRARAYMLVALISFLSYATLGWISSNIYPDFTAAILGEGYVQETINNISKGTPLAIYEGQSSFSMFIQITGNNLMISILIFLSGILFTLGTHFFLFYNGVMLGSFQQFFFKKGLFITSFLGIWIHGAFEISSIILAGGAGMTAGAGWLFPGSLSRFNAFKSSFSRGAKIMMSLIPFILLAGYLESYVTRHYDTLPDTAKWIIILGSFLLIAFLYLFMPLYQARRHPERIVQEPLYQPPHLEDIQILQNKSNGLIFRQGIVYFFRGIGQWIQNHLIRVFIIGIVLMLLRAFVSQEDLNYVYWFDWANHLSFIMGYTFSLIIDPFISLVWAVLISYIFMLIFHQMQQSAFTTNLTFKGYLIKYFWRVFVGVLIVIVPIFLLPWNFLLFILCIYPFLLYLPAALAFSNYTWKEAFKKGLVYGLKSYFTLLMLMIITLLSFTVIIQPFSFVFSIENEIPDVLDLLVKGLTPFFDDAGLNSIFWTNLVREAVYLLLLIFAVVYFSVVLGLSFFSTLEKREACQLKRELEVFGTRSRLKESLIQDKE